MAAKPDAGMFDVDIRRFTFIGWIVVLLSAAVGLGCGYWTFVNFGLVMSWFGARPEEGGRVPIYLLIIVGVAAAALVFAAGKLLLQFVGIHVIRPAVSEEP